jgi:predicted oxidoreductase
MKKVFLSEVGPEISNIIYSFWRAHEELEGVKYSSVLSKLNTCLDLGINTFDHADIYGDYQIEELFGKALKESAARREDVVIITKCGLNVVDHLKTSYRIRHYDSSPEHIIEKVECSLYNFQTDYIDVLLLNHFDPLIDADETALVLSNLVKSGKVKYIGVANYTVQQFKLLQSRLHIHLLTNLIELNVLNTKAITDGTIDFIKQQRSRLMAWSPLAGGRLVDKNDDSTFNIRNTLNRIAEKYEINEEQLAIAWLVNLGVLPIVGSNNASKIKNATSAVEIKLDRQDWHEIYFSSLNN